MFIRSSCDMWLRLSVPCDVSSHIQQTTSASVTQLDISNTPVDISRRVCGDQARLTFREKSHRLHPWWWPQKQVFKAFSMMSPLQNQNINTAVWWQKQRIQPQKISLLSVVLQKHTAYICSGDRVGVLQSHLQYLVSADSTCVIIMLYQLQLICIIIHYNYI